MAGAEASADDFDTVVIPGGSAPEELRVNEDVVKFVKELNHNSKVVAGICHGPQVMISANILAGKKLTCYIGIRDDVINGGAEYYIDDEVIVSQNLITSRKVYQKLVKEFEIIDITWEELLQDYISQFKNHYNKKEQMHSAKYKKLKQNENGKNK